MQKRVLILSTSAGSGHKAAAAAIEKVFRQSSSVAEVINKDALEFTNDTFRQIYSDLFLELVKNNPHLLGWWYDESDQPWKTDEWRLLFDRLNTEPLIQFIREFSPDIVVCTHYMPAGIISHMLARRQIDAVLGIVTTDFDFHSMWLSRAFHRYFVALDETKAHLTAVGLPASRITVSGIPVDPAFGRPADRAAIVAHYGLRDDQPVLLLSAGAVGGGPIRAIVDQLMQLKHATQTVVVCGKNRDLRRAVEAQVVPQAERFRVLGYTTDMAALMQAATLFIGKPGGLTSSECLAAGLPMLIGMPIPGQEERNSDHLLEKGAAIKFNDITVISYKIDRLLDEPQRLDCMRRAARRLGRADAARTIVETLLSDAELPPMQISKAAKQRMAESIVSPGEAVSAPLLPRGIIIYNEQTGVPAGPISEADLQFLVANLEVESLSDDNYYLNAATIDMLRERGASATLLEALTVALGENEDIDIRWSRL